MTCPHPLNERVSITYLVGWCGVCGSLDINGGWVTPDNQKIRDRWSESSKKIYDAQGQHIGYETEFGHMTFRKTPLCPTCGKPENGDRGDDLCWCSEDGEK